MRPRKLARADAELDRRIHRVHAPIGLRGEGRSAGWQIEFLKNVSTNAKLYSISHSILLACTGLK